jgi:hypothetical protein
VPLDQVQTGIGVHEMLDDVRADHQIETSAQIFVGLFQVDGNEVRGGHRLLHNGSQFRAIHQRDVGAHRYNQVPDLRSGAAAYVEYVLETVLPNKVNARRINVVLEEGRCA